MGLRGHMTFSSFQGAPLIMQWLLAIHICDLSLEHECPDHSKGFQWAPQRNANSLQEDWEQGKAENVTQPLGPSRTFSFAFPDQHPVLLSLAGMRERVYALGSGTFLLLLVFKNHWAYSEEWSASTSDLLPPHIYGVFRPFLPET